MISSSSPPPLPRKLWVEIFSHLDAKLLFKVGIVCKEWDAIAWKVLLDGKRFSFIDALSPEGRTREVILKIASNAIFYNHCEELTPIKVTAYGSPSYNTSNCLTLNCLFSGCQFVHFEPIEGKLLLVDTETECTTLIENLPDLCEEEKQFEDQSLYSSFSVGGGTVYLSRRDGIIVSYRHGIFQKHVVSPENYPLSLIASNERLIAFYTCPERGGSEISFGIYDLLDNRLVYSSSELPGIGPIIFSDHGMITGVITSDTLMYFAGIDLYCLDFRSEICTLLYSLQHLKLGFRWCAALQFSALFTYVQGNKIIFNDLKENKSTTIAHQFDSPILALDVQGNVVTAITKEREGATASLMIRKFRFALDTSN